ncbi:MAG: hypothetical protein H6636_07700 [Anaerolineales bacterium]|nr:hypothetical protein [Anaerolineales bacterium]
MDNQFVIFRYKLGFRIWFFILAIFFALFAGWLLIQNISFDNTVHSMTASSESFIDSVTQRLSIFTFFIAIGVVLLAFLAIYSAIYYQKYRLIFGKTHLFTRAWWYPGMPKITCAYNEIQWITRGETRGMVKFFPKQGKSFRLAANALEGGWPRLSQEIYARFTPAQIDPDLSLSLQKNNFLDGLQFLAKGVMLFFPIAQILLLPTISPLYNHWWKPVTNIKELRVETTFADTDGSTWIIAQKDLHFSDYTIYHVQGNTTTTWAFSTDERGVSGSPELIASDGKGNPWVFFDNLAFRWENSQWQRIELPQELKNAFLPYYTAIISEADFWSFSYSEEFRPNGILHWDLANNTTSFFPFPKDNDDTYWSEMTSSPQGDLWLTKSPKDLPGNIKTYRFDGLSWYEGPSFSVSNLKNLDTAVDSSGQIWLLLSSYDNKIFSVARYNPTTLVWERTELPEYWKGKRQKSYEQIEVDALGRIWLLGKTQERFYEWFITVVQPAWGGLSKDLVTYTHDNSAVDELFFTIQMGHDGKVWMKENARFMNGNAEKLPRPLPDWYSKLGFYFGIVIVYALASVTQFIIVVPKNKIKKHPQSSQP